ncbi:hypothetical protein BASA50_011281 [Batrachochytrium salamandrivorans]|uniref:Uncharacterized protein n=1 Tax=Batrachochytrium salamandrivorans TaxID=1357716 RepID=A0ABQ8EWB3_9FUNG|nr:hypothetical protein BASA60_007872 [Batrachochytrium salamandrivorans]KAH6574955.1 hypothetical protein BASA62_002215 [Batrachochytrium salamandrivorans]KAH6580800.1 hypothetical protein BASA61_009410 [Batrachochytrium salamandrivorans]KAH6587677.1 hypothetical protein BASA50_011281 [Batrachochytrium salamandrivorans]KAH9245995.1 hypothetical protein BASA81_016488 [Batrachochytrium salamandrivorans]
MNGAAGTSYAASTPMSGSAMHSSTTTTPYDTPLCCITLPCLCPWWRSRVQPVFDYDEIDDLEFENLLSTSGVSGPFQTRSLSSVFWDNLASLFRLRSYHASDTIPSTSPSRSAHSYSYTYNYSPVATDAVVYGATTHAAGVFTSVAPPGARNLALGVHNHHPGRQTGRFDNDDTLFGHTEADAELMTDEQVRSITAAASSLRHLEGDGMQPRPAQKESIEKPPSRITPPFVNHAPTVHIADRFGHSRRGLLNGEEENNVSIQPPSTHESGSSSPTAPIGESVPATASAQEHQKHTLLSQQQRIYKSATGSMMSDPLNAVHFLVEPLKDPIISESDKTDHRKPPHEEVADDEDEGHFDANLLLKLQGSGKG